MRYTGPAVGRSLNLLAHCRRLQRHTATGTFDRTSLEFCEVLRFRRYGVARTFHPESYVSRQNLSFAEICEFVPRTAAIYGHSRGH